MSEAGGLLLENGHKARQRVDTEDRGIPFSEALRNHGIPATDVDFVLTNGKDVLRAVIEITRPDKEVWSPRNYLAAIDERRKAMTVGNHNDGISSLIAERLGIPAILVVFETDVETGKIFYRGLLKKTWFGVTPASEFFEQLKELALTGKSVILDFINQNQ